MEPKEIPDASAQSEAEGSQVTRPPGGEEVSPPESQAAPETIEPTVVTDEEEEEKEGDDEEAPRRVRMRTRTNWLLTVIVGLGALMLGGMGGYLVHSAQTAPSIEKLASLEREATVTAATAATVTAQQKTQQQPTPDMKALLAELVSKTRHFKGDAKAPVTILEFSDFQ